ncbi:hypothetical protein MYU51_008695 [Penicillium brevicompactum]
MRSGLHKPGALPLLALVVFSLLTLVPSLSSIYNLKLADFSFYSGAARHLPLLQDGVTELPQAHPFETREPRPLAAPHRSRVNLSPRTARAANPAAISASETVNKSRIVSPRESSFSFSRRARAFRSYFIQHLDDYPFLSSFSNRTLAEPHSHPLNHFLPTDQHTIAPQIDELEHPLTIREIYQQASRYAIDFGKLASARGSEYARSIFSTAETPSTSIPHPTDVELDSGSDSGLDTPEQPEQLQKVGAEDSSDAAAGRHSQELQGSCMAVVIGLVAGIMWF